MAWSETDSPPTRPELEAPAHTPLERPRAGGDDELELARLARELERQVAEAKAREAELESALRRLRAMTEIALSLGGETEIDRVLGVIARRGRSLVEARTMLVLLKQNGGLLVAASAGDGEGEVDGAHVGSGATAAGEVLASGSPARLDSSSGGLILVDGERGIRASAALFVPLTFRGRAYGVLAAADRLVAGPSFSDEDERLLRSYASTAVAAVATARSVQEERLRRSIDASENERRRIARDLHDEALQGLAALRVSLSWAFKHGSEDDLRDAVGGAVEQIAAEIETIRHLIVELRPAVLDDLGLAAALEALAERHRSDRGLEIDVVLDLGSARPARLAAEIESTVYRLVQEALTNVQKHARAHHVGVAVRVAGSEVQVEVSDDGVGFERQAPDGGFGLIGMLERVTMAGGKLDVASTPGTGTTVRAWIPLDGAAEPRVDGAADTRAG